MTMAGMKRGDHYVEKRCEDADFTELQYAQRLAMCLWERHWKEDAPQWKPAKTMIEVLDQIDNATAGLVRPTLTLPNGDRGREAT